MHVWRSAHSWLRGWSDAKGGFGCHAKDSYNPEAYIHGFDAAYNAAGTLPPEPCRG
ncbi:MAG: hypothetical protein KGL39_29810 [Patescibacteria group bacterium]|nr:hypothetical protein [Patescibacteria group bacterium]